MFRELVELGKELESQGKLPPAGFYDYGEPVEWIVHLWPNRIYLEQAELQRPRPFDGRTSSIRAHPLADEAAYALGVSQQKGGGTDRQADQKHRAFRALVGKFQHSPAVQDPALLQAVGWLTAALERGDIPSDARYQQIAAKDWVSFSPEEGPLQGQQLFEHPDAIEFWAQEVQERSAPDEGRKTVIGECGICGEVQPLIGKIPLKVKLVSTVPLHGLNADSFVSYISGRERFKKAHLGLCFRCGDTASRAFNYLSNSQQHRRDLLRHRQKRDSLANQTALFWLKAPAPIRVGDLVLNAEEIQAQLSAPLTNIVSTTLTDPEPRLTQLARLLDLPWQPHQASLLLDAYAFYLALVSPNIGRIAVREWFAVSLSDLLERLQRFVAGISLVDPWGQESGLLSIPAILNSLSTHDPNLTRALLRTAYLGQQPPSGLRSEALTKVRALWVKGRQEKVEEEGERLRRIHALTAAIKLTLLYGKEADSMDELDPEHLGSLCGQLLAVVEEAQRRAAGRQRLANTLAERFYGAVAVAPATILGGILLTRLTSAYLPKIRRESRGVELETLVGTVLKKIHSSGGFPLALSPEERAWFALGFYVQRATFQAERAERLSRRTA